MTVNLPKTNQTGKAEFADVEDNDVALKEAIETLQSEVAAISGITWYTPKVIATEETRENTSFGTLTTPDEIKSVVVPENGLILVGYRALVKQSVAETGAAAVFLGANQLKGWTSAANAVVARETEKWPGTSFLPLFSDSRWGLSASVTNFAAENPVTTGFLVGLAGGVSAGGGFAVIEAAAGTYDISVKFKSSSGSVTAKERKLWVATLG